MYLLKTALRGIGGYVLLWERFEQMGGVWPGYGSNIRHHRKRLTASCCKVCANKLTFERSLAARTHA